MSAEKFRILAVDDDKDILDLVHLTLGEKYELLTLRDAVNACEILEFLEPDLVIVDVMMPKVTGYQIVDYLKKTPNFQHVLIVFLSAKDSSRDIKYAYKIGANFYLVKPFQPERLLKSVEMLLQQTGGYPRRKTYSMRDVMLRMQMKIGLHLPESIAAETEAEGGGIKLRRPLAQQAENDKEEENRKKWVG